MPKFKKHIFICMNQREPEGVWYGGVKPEDVDEIIDSHILRNEPVERLRISDEILNTTHKKKE